PERHADDLHPIRDRPVDREVHYVAGARATEYAVRVDVGVGCDARADVPRVRRHRGCVVRPAEGDAVAENPKPGSGARRMRSVAVAVERVRIGLRDGIRYVGVVGIAHEIEAALHLWRGGPEQGWIGGSGARRFRRSEVARVSRSAEVRMRVVDARIDDGDLHARSGNAEVPPSLRSADEGHAVDVDGVERSYGVQRDNAGEGCEL